MHEQGGTLPSTERPGRLPAPRHTRPARSSDVGTGASFAAALRAAIDASGLGLERLRARLGERGVSVSTATLSYWQSGRSRPARRSSLEAVAHLEDVLRVGRGSLSAHLTKAAVATNPRFEDLVAVEAPLPDWLQRAHSQLRSSLTILSEHDTIHVGANGVFASRWVRQIFRADVVGADRYFVLHLKHAPSDPEPELEALTHCRQGVVHRSPELGLVAHEILFDRVLDKGESIIVEYRQTCPPGSTDDMSYEIRRRSPLHELVLEVRFDEAALPVRCEAYQSALDGSSEVTSDAELDASHSVRVIRYSADPGRYGVRWFPG